MAADQRWVVIVHAASDSARAREDAAGLEALGCRVVLQVLDAEVAPVAGDIPALAVCLLSPDALERGLLETANAWMAEGAQVLLAALTPMPAVALPDATAIERHTLTDVAWRDKLYWHVERALARQSNREGASRDTRMTRWMLTGLGVFLAVLIASLFHMSYYQ